MKTYFSKGRNYAVTIMVGGKIQFIRFSDMGQYLNKGVFTTNSKEIADALEAHPRFKQCFFLDNGEIDNPEPEPVEEHVYDATYMVKRTQDAIRILVEKHGVEHGTIKNRQGALAKAAELNIAFPNL